jgi:hypothetical protein
MQARCCCPWRRHSLPVRSHIEAPHRERDSLLGFRAFSINHLAAPLRERAGLVEAEDAHARERLEHGAALDEHALLRRTREAADHGDGRAEHQCAGAGRDEDLQRQIDPVLRATARARPERRRQRAGGGWK